MHQQNKICCLKQTSHQITQITCNYGLEKFKTAWFSNNTINEFNKFYQYITP